MIKYMKKKTGQTLIAINSIQNMSPLGISQGFGIQFLYIYTFSAIMEGTNSWIMYNSKYGKMVGFLESNVSTS